MNGQFRDSKVARNCLDREECVAEVGQLRPMEKKSSSHIARWTYFVLLDRSLTSLSISRRLLEWHGFGSFGTSLVHERTAWTPPST